MRFSATSPIRPPLSFVVLDSPAALFDYLRERYRLSSLTAADLELWWKLTVDGETVMQVQAVHAERVGADFYVIVSSAIHGTEPVHAARAGERRSVGELANVDGRAMLSQRIVAGGHDGAHVERIMLAVAEEAARIALRVRRSRRNTIEAA